MRDSFRNSGSAVITADGVGGEAVALRRSGLGRRIEGEFSPFGGGEQSLRLFGMLRRDEDLHRSETVESQPVRFP